MSDDRRPAAWHDAEMAEFIQALGLPVHVVEFTLRVRAGGQVTVECSFVPSVGGLTAGAKAVGKLLAVHYELVLKKQAKA
jgi:hypothetical protein